MTGTKLEGLRGKVFMDRYALKGPDGMALEKTPEQMWHRVAKGIAGAENTPEKRKFWEEKFYQALEDFKFVPGGRILSGAGTRHEVTYYNCFVIPSPEDSREGIIKNLGQMVELMSRGGGVGVNLSSLRPKGTYIKSVNGHSSGPCAWAELYSVATGDVIQQGGTRRGALMLMLNDDHPDIVEFINRKRDLKKLNHANLSVCVSDALMTQVKLGGKWQLKWNGQVFHTMDAKELWNHICESAWKSGEPGLVFMERYNKQSNTHYYEDIICVNPCGEQGLPAWGVCNLGAINLERFVEGYDPATGTPGKFNFAALVDVTKVATRFLDNVIDQNLYFQKENAQAQLQTRRIGLGTMGLADALIKMHLPYGSPISLAVIEKIYEVIRNSSYEASCQIAGEKTPFPKWDKLKYLKGKFIKRLPEWLQDDIATRGVRNAVLLTQAPTGTTSLLSGVSSGIEPVYDFITTRKDRIGTHIMVHPLLEEWQETNPENPKPAWFVASNDLTPEDHVRVQAKIQEYTDSSISKTVNAPNSHKVEDVERLYMMAYDLGCKGVTYFRDGCREGVLSHGVEGTTPQVTPQATPEVKAPEELLVPAGYLARRTRPSVTHAQTTRTATPQGVLWSTLTFDQELEPLEVFLHVGKTGSDMHSLTEALGRSITEYLRSPGPQSARERLEALGHQFRGIGGSERMLGLPRSVPDAVATMIDTYLNDSLEPQDETPYLGISSEATSIQVNGGLVPSNSLPAKSIPAKSTSIPAPATVDLCPECGVCSLVREEGCHKCYNCGYSKCG